MHMYLYEPIYQKKKIRSYLALRDDPAILQFLAYLGIALHRNTHHRLRYL